MLQLANRSRTPDWLPAGWILEIKTQKSGANVGRQIKCYYDPRSGSRFYSKKAVFRHLEEGMDTEPPAIRKHCCSTNRGENTKINSNTNACSNNQMDFIQTKNTNDLLDHAPNGLPSGWITETRFRKSKSTIKKDTLYIDPVGGYVLRSLKDVLRYVKTGDIHDCVLRTVKIKVKGTTKTESNPETSTARLSRPRTGVQRCLFSEERPVMKLCREINKSPLKAQVLAQVTGSANVKLQPEEDLSAEKNKLVEETNLERHSKEQSRPKKPKRSQQMDSKKVPVRASKRLAALRGDDLTESGVSDGLGDAISAPNDQLKSTSFMNFDNRSKLPKSILDVPYLSALPSHVQQEVQDTSFGSASKLLQEVSNGLSAEQNNLVEEMKMEATNNGQASFMKPGRRHQSVSKRNKHIKAITMPVRASKRLAALRYDALGRCVIDDSDYCMSMLNSQLEANSNENFDHRNKLPVVTIDNGTVSKLSERKLEEQPKIVSAVIQTESEEWTVGKVKVVEDAALELKSGEQPQAKKLKTGHPQSSKKNKHFKTVAVPVRASKRLAALVAKDLETTGVKAPGDDKGTYNHHLEQNTCNYHQSKPPMAAEKLKRSKSTVASVFFEELPKTSVAIERFEEQPKTSLFTERFKEQPIELVTSLDHKEVPERKEPHGNEATQGQVELERPDNLKPEAQFISLFGDSWPDPCIEFAFKTLTGDIPEDYIQLQQQPIDSTTRTNNCPGPCTNKSASVDEENKLLPNLGLWDDHQRLFSHDDTPCFLEHNLKSTNKND